MSSLVPQVTVGILSHDGAAYLQETLASVRTQTYPNLQVIVLDNGSTDSTGEILAQQSDIRVIRETTNIGCGPGRNRLVSAATGDYILFLDDDVTLPDPRTIEVFVAFSRSMHDRCLTSLVLEEGDTGWTTHYGLFFAPLKRAVRFDELRGIPPFCVAAPLGGCTFISRAVFRSLEGFDPIYPFNLGDYDLGARAHLRGIRTWILTSTHGVHRGAARRVDSRTWEWRESYYLCGMIRTLAKSCRLRTGIVWIPGAACWIVLRAIAQWRRRGVVPVARALLRSAVRVARDAPSTLSERQRLQECRTVKDDRFLTLMPPRRCRNRLALTIGRIVGDMSDQERAEGVATTSIVG